MNKQNLFNRRGMAPIVVLLVFFVLAMSILSVVTVDYAYADTTGVVNDDGCYVRTGPGTNYTRLSYLNKGTVVTILGSSGDWYKIKYSSTTGYMHKTLINVSSGSSSNTTTQNISTGLYKVNGQWRYYENGRFKSATGLVKRPDTGRWYYVKNGIYSKETTITKKVQNDGKWYYVENGAFKKSTGLAKRKDNGKWYYVQNGVYNRNFTGLAQRIDTGAWFYVRNGAYYKYTGNVTYNGKSYYVYAGNVVNISPTGASGVHVPAGALYGIVDGPLNVRSGPGTTYSRIGILADGSKVRVLSPGTGWHQMSYNGTTGYVSADYLSIPNGIYKVSGKWRYYEKGQFKAATGLVKRPDTGRWYYVEKGIYNNKYTGIAPRVSDGKLYYVKNGAFTKYTGTATYQGKKYNVKEGEATLAPTTSSSSSSTSSTKSSASTSVANALGNNGSNFLNGSSAAITKSDTVGIDVSQFQGNIDWTKVGKSGVKFAFVRVGGRFAGAGTWYADSYAQANLKGSMNAGLRTGAYVFTQATTEAEAREEAQKAIAAVKKAEAATGKKLTLPIVIDTEEFSGGTGRHDKISIDQRTKVIKAFCDYVQANGYKPMIYAGYYWMTKKLNYGELSKYPLWFAQYYSSPSLYDKLVTPRSTMKCWQYSDSGRVDGISGNVDMDKWYGNWL